MAPTGTITIRRPGVPGRFHTLSISANAARSVSIRNSPVAPRCKTSFIASNKTSRGGIPAVPRMVTAVLLNTAAGNFIVAPALSPTCTSRVSFPATVNSPFVSAASKASVGSTPQIIQNHIKARFSHLAQIGFLQRIRRLVQLYRCVGAQFTQPGQNPLIPTDPNYPRRSKQLRDLHRKLPGHSRSAQNQHRLTARKLRPVCQR